MDTLAESLKQFGWPGVVLVAVIILLINPSSEAFLEKLFGLGSKIKETQIKTRPGEFTIVRMMRTRPISVVLKPMRVISAICSGLLAISFGFLLIILSLHPPKDGATNLQMALTILFLIPLFLFIDDVWPINSPLSLQSRCSADILFKDCLRFLFQLGASISSFDAEALNITAKLYGQDVEIKISKVKDGITNLDLISKSTLLLTLTYSKQYRQSIDAMVRQLSYSDETNESQSNLAV